TQETTANARPTRKSIWPLPGRPQYEIFRKLAGNVGESAASVRLLSDKVNKFCRASLERDLIEAPSSSIRMGRLGDATDRCGRRRPHNVARTHSAPRTTAR